MPLSPYNSSHENYRAFQEYSTNNDNIVAFTGAGTSVIPGIPVWKAFLKRLNEVVNTDLDLDVLLNEGKVEEAAEQIYNSLPDPAYFYQGINQLIQEDQRAFSTDIHAAIWTVFDRVLTTNYDRCYEFAMDLRHRMWTARGLSAEPFEWQELPTLNFDEFASPEKRLAYLHGRTGSENLILRDIDYKKYYPSCNSGAHADPCNELENFLYKVIEKYSLVFIGFSLDDKNFVETFENCRAQIAAKLAGTPELKEFQARKHFIFLRNDDVKDYINTMDLYEANLNVNQVLDARILKRKEGDPDRLTFGINHRNAYTKAALSPEDCFKLDELYKTLMAHQQKIDRLQKLNVLDIRLTGSDFKSIVDLLLQSGRVDGTADAIGIDSI